ncbi:hypothetical protein [Streptomyces sp. NPDC057695]
MTAVAVWKCPDCDTNNDARDVVCKVCAVPRPSRVRKNLRRSD